MKWTDWLPNIWTLVAALVGIGFGSWLTVKNQRKQWLMDNKRSEYRKLLNVLADSGSKFVVFYGAMPIVASPKQQFMIGETARKSVDVIYNRLFIAAEVQRLDIQGRWERAISALQKTRDVNAFGKAMDGVMSDIRTAAIKAFS